MSDSLEATLAATRSLLETQIAEIEASGKESAGISFGKRIGEGTSIAVERLNQIASHKKLVGQHRAVVRGQAKLAEGTYGRCDSCEVTIGADRLQALPWANHCIDCAAVAARPADEEPGPSAPMPAPRPSHTSHFADSPWSAVLGDGESGPSDGS